MTDEIRELFISEYNTEPVMVTSPGRVNLIGEHTDYNEGYVLPGAIDKKIVVAIAPNDGTKINVLAREFNETLSFCPKEISPSKGWKNYILGVTHYIQEQTGAFEQGFNVIIDGDVPVGGGMSSSAALCSAYGFALNHVFNLGLSRLDLALIGQKTEHNFVGVKVGIMDQFASLHGKAGHLIKLDCRSLEYEYIPFDFPDYNIVMVNSMVSHSLAGSEYNVRRQQCEEGVSILKKRYPQVKSLRDISSSELAAVKEEMSPIVYQRCKYVVEEKERLLAACDALKRNNLDEFGKLMYKTHEGLSKEYEVSCLELDFLVDEARKHSSVAGSRMMGGGFGGCTINIVKKEAVSEFVSAVQQAFRKEYNKVPEVYITTIEDGAKVVEGRII